MFPPIFPGCLSRFLTGLSEGCIASYIRHMFASNNEAFAAQKEQPPAPNNTLRGSCSTPCYEGPTTPVGKKRFGVLGALFCFGESEGGRLFMISVLHRGPYGSSFHDCLVVCTYAMGVGGAGGLLAHDDSTR